MVEGTEYSSASNPARNAIPKEGYILSEPLERRIIYDIGDGAVGCKMIVFVHIIIPFMFRYGGVLPGLHHI